MEENEKKLFFAALYYWLGFNWHVCVCAIVNTQYSQDIFTRY